MIIKEKRIDKIIKNKAKSNKKIKNSFFAFLFGGMIGLVSQIIYDVFIKYFSLSEEVITSIVIGIIIFIAFILTCVGKYDEISSIAGAGMFIPITGFSNAITSSTIEGKSEGLIFGIGGKMFSLIGSVFAYGIVSSIILGIIYFFIK